VLWKQLIVVLPKLSISASASMTAQLLTQTAAATPSIDAQLPVELLFGGGLSLAGLILVFLARIPHEDPVNETPFVA